MHKRLKLLLQIMMLFIIAPSIFAYGDLGIGQVADNLLSPVTLASDFVNSASVLIGVSFVFASIVKYVEHRRSPLMVPISTVIFLLIAGIFLIILPLTYLVTTNGIPFPLMT